MSKTLDKVVKTASKLGLAGILACSAGCNIESMYGMGIAGNAYKTHDPYAANVMGNALMREGEAREGRSETVVVQQPREDNSNNPQPQPDNGFRNGTLRWSDGQVYTGDILDNKPHGKGVMILKDGHRYNGQFKNGVIEGYGVMEDKNGYKYEGGFHNNKREGYGKFTFKSGEVLEGYWKDDDFVGKEKPSK